MRNGQEIPSSNPVEPAAIQTGVDADMPHPLLQSGHQSFLDRLRAQVSSQRKNAEDPWTPKLRAIRGYIGSDGVESISTDHILEFLGLPPTLRSPQEQMRVRRLMLTLGWHPVRQRFIARHGRASRIRGYARWATREKREWVD